MKILLAAVAKNESLYLSEWIYHHISIGVDEVWIYINNTNDSSREILASMRNNGVNVRTIEADTIVDSTTIIDNQNAEPEFLKRNPLQSRAFSNIYNNARKEGFDYIAFFDVDEFLYIGDQSLQSLIINSSYPEVLRFNWFCQFFDDTPFETTFKPRMIGEKKMLPKNIVCTKDPFLKFRSTHDINFSNKKAKAWFASIGIVSWQFNFREAPWGEDYFIVHRVFRSKREFLALIGNGDNIKEGEVDGFKLNRFSGWAPKPIHDIKLDANYVNNYIVGYNDFIKRCDIAEILLREQSQLDSRLDKIKDRINTLPKRVNKLMNGIKNFDLI